MLTKEEVIKILEDTKVLQEGHFVLTSGRHSKQYMQMAQALQYANATERLCNSLTEYFKKKQIDVVVSPAMGGIIVGYELSRQLGARNIFCERVNGKMTLRRGFKIEANERVLIVEDVVTTGGSVKEVIEIVEQTEGQIIGIASLIDRSSGNLQFSYPYKALLEISINSYDPKECPLCIEESIPPLKPGSRNT